MPIFPGPDGVQRACVANNQEINRGAFAITHTNEYAAATMRWADMLFDPAMSAQANWGPIGVSQELNDDGLLEQIPVGEGETEQERRVKVSPGGPKIITAEGLRDGRAARATCRRAPGPDRRVLRAPSCQREVPSGHALGGRAEHGSAPSKRTSTTLVTEKIATWIVKGGIEDEWDGYVAQLESIGLPEVLAVYQTAYDRFASSTPDRERPSPSTAAPTTLRPGHGFHRRCPTIDTID